MARFFASPVKLPKTELPQCCVHPTICRMSDCIVGWRLRVMALIFLFLSIFLSFPILHVNIKNLCWSFHRNF